MSGLSPGELFGSKNRTGQGEKALRGVQNQRKNASGLQAVGRPLPGRIRPPYPVPLSPPKFKTLFLASHVAFTAVWAERCTDESQASFGVITAPLELVLTVGFRAAKTGSSLFLGRVESYRQMQGGFIKRHVVNGGPQV